ncbi:hypothetical protein HD806DRAFT_396006 [Xylariaceae sp. AK1471]|nr:hypothetical protein HD806DRAFT_396006 [Xylariaceae sp. AK1471]
MPISFYDVSTGLHLRGLQVLTNILSKAKAHAAAHNIPVDEVVGWRLVDDMKPLSFQVQYMCITALKFLNIGAHLDVPTVEDSEKTFSDLEARIASTVELLKGIDRASVDGKEDKKAALPDALAKHGEFTGSEYLFGNNNPNFYFHLVTAYDILRAKGVDLGKRDYLRPHIPDRP